LSSVTASKQELRNIYSLRRMRGYSKEGKQEEITTQSISMCVQLKECNNDDRTSVACNTHAEV
jgi:hypothetical protein